MVYSWGSLLQQMSSQSSHFYIAGFSCTLDGTWEEMMVWICWSFAALQHGYHPPHDPEGKPLKKDSPFFLEKGKPLAHGLCGVLWVVQGDHEFFSNSLKLPHLGMLSQEEAKPANMCYKTLEKGKQAWKRISTGVIPGLSTKMVRGDCLHILFVKGVLGHLLGSCIHYF